jgi:hypothetical protein
VAEKERELVLAVLFRTPESRRDPDYSHEVGPALWAAFREVEKFYNTGEQRVRVRCAYLAADVPEPFREENRWIENDWGQIGAAIKRKDSWRELRGRRTRTVDQTKLANWVRGLTGLPTPGPRLILVTDQEITPLEGFRYIIWDAADNEHKDGVVSVAPIDPNYWGIEDDIRIATIKHRVRVACLALIGSGLGLGKCKNARCFRCRPVESVEDLDRMIYLGEEHDLPELALKGFDPIPTDPAAVQPLRTFRKRYRGDENP